MNTIKPALLINLSANAGRAEKSWITIEKEVMDQVPLGTEVCTYHIPFDLDEKLSAWLDEGINCFIIGGGDGSINYLLNLLAGRFNQELQPYFIGAIGLGSSNDFHKPFQKRIKNIPIKLNIGSSRLVDLGRVKFNNINNIKTTRYFIINSSIGVTAEANILFNIGDWVIKFLKPKNTNATIIYTAIKSIIVYKNIDGSLEYNGIKEQVRLSNLAILKNPHVSGSFRFDQNIKMDDSMLGLNACIQMSKFELIKTLIDLGKGIFSGNRKRISSFTKKVNFDTDHPIALETDGEVMMAKCMAFDVCPLSINILNS